MLCVFFSFSFFLFLSLCVFCYLLSSWRNKVYIARTRRCGSCSRSSVCRGRTCCRRTVRWCSSILQWRRRCWCRADPPCSPPSPVRSHAQTVWGNAANSATHHNFSRPRAQNYFQWAYHQLNTMAGSGMGCSPSHLEGVWGVGRIFSFNNFASRNAYFGAAPAI